MTENHDRAAGIATRVHPEPELERRAALFVASQARDAGDCALLLDALGLLGRPVRGSARVRQEQKRTTKEAK